MSYRRLPLVLFLATAAAPALAADRTWPNLFGVGPCTGTLQACVDGAAAGDTVIIGGDDLAFPDSYTLVDESLVINKSLTLKGARGIDAVFAPNRTILVDAGGTTTPIQVAIESLSMRRGGIRFEHRASAAGSIYRVERVRILDVAESFPTPCAIAAYGPGIAPSELRVFDNSIRIEAGRASRAFGICSVTQFSTATIARNRIEAANGAMRNGLNLSGSGTASFRITGNTILGDDFLNGIYIAQASNPFRYDISIDSNVVAGQRASVEFGAGIGFYLGDAQLRVVNNTVVDGRNGIAIVSFTDNSIDGEVSNNLVAFNSAASIAGLVGGIANVTNRNNLVFGNATDPFTAGPGTVTANPQLVSLRDPRVSWVSPAFNAGVNAALPVFSAFDADGEPRIVYGTVDIGAYEENDDRTRSQLARSDNTTLNYVTVDPSDGAPYSTTSVLAATPQHAVGEVPADQNIGVWLSNAAPAEWSIFHEDSTVPIPLYRRHSVMVVGNGRTGYVHDTTLGTIVDQFSQLDHPQLNARPAAIAIATHAFASGATTAYHDFPIGLDYFGGRWYVRNEDSAPMPPTRRFHVVIAPEFTLNAWRVSNTAGGAVQAIRLEHPLLDDNPCAAPLAGRVDPSLPAVNNPAPFAMQYRAGFGGAAGHWYIAAQGAGATIPSGAEYNVMIDGSQVNACRNAELLPLFADSFE